METNRHLAALKLMMKRYSLFFSVLSFLPTSNMTFLLLRDFIVANEGNSHTKQLSAKNINLKKRLMKPFILSKKMNKYFHR